MRIYKHKWHFKNHYVEKAYKTLDIAHTVKDIRIDRFSNQRPPTSGHGGV